MKRETVKRKLLQKMIKAEYKKYKAHKDFKLGKVFHLDTPDKSGCNWSIPISREHGWEMAAEFIRPYIIMLRAKYLLADERHDKKRHLVH